MHDRLAEVVLDNRDGVLELQFPGGGEAARGNEELLGAEGILERDPNQRLRDVRLVRMVDVHAVIIPDRGGIRIRAYSPLCC